MGFDVKKDEGCDVLDVLFHAKIATSEPVWRR